MDHVVVSSWPPDPTVDDGLGTDLALGYTANKLCRGSPHRRGELLYDADPSRPPGSQTHYRCRPPFNSSHDLRCIHYCFTSVAFVVYIIVSRFRPGIRRHTTATQRSARIVLTIFASSTAESR